MIQIINDMNEIWLTRGGYNACRCYKKDGEELWVECGVTTAECKKHCCNPSRFDNYKRGDKYNINFEKMHNCIEINDDDIYS